MRRVEAHAKSLISAPRNSACIRETGDIKGLIPFGLPRRNFQRDAQEISMHGDFTGDGLGPP